MPNFLLDPRKKKAKSRRRPGVLFKLLRKVPPSAPPWMHDYTRVLDHILQKLWFVQDNSLPGKHATTHMGGSDSVSGDGIPSPVVAGQSGSRGDPREGFAPFLHVHALDLDPIIPTLPEEMPGVSNPPFSTLAQQQEFLTAQAVHANVNNPALICRYF